MSIQGNITSREKAWTADRHITGDSQNNCIKKKPPIRYVLYKRTYIKFKNGPNKSM